MDNIVDNKNDIIFYEDEELKLDSTCSILEHVGNNGTQSYKTKYYNLYMIISIGFRVNSKYA